MNTEEPIEARYVILTQAILGDPKLTPSEKMLLARISGFVRFYEANETTAEFLGLSERTIRNAKRKLEKLGYIVEIGDTGHGKIYAPDLLRVAKIAGLVGKNCRSGRQKLPPENKYRINKTLKSDDKAVEGVENSEKEHGRQDINELVELWETETKISIKGDANQRRQIYNLIRKHGHDEAKAIIERVGKMRQAKDRYAPSIMKPSDLVGKYSKLDRLIAWEERQSLKAPQPINTAWRVAPPKREEISDAERAAVAEQFKEARKKLQFLHKDN